MIPGNKEFGSKEDLQTIRQSETIRRRRVTALLEMAAEAEKLGRYKQAEHLYERALIMTSICFGPFSAQRAAILWDLGRVSELLQEGKSANKFYKRAYEIGFASQFRNMIGSA